ncbi:unnamed protein product, partial [Protopolystoma xenopodis]
MFRAFRLLQDPLVTVLFLLGLGSPNRLAKRQIHSEKVATEDELKPFLRRCCQRTSIVSNRSRIALSDSSGYLAGTRSSHPKTEPLLSTQSILEVSLTLEPFPIRNAPEAEEYEEGAVYFSLIRSPIKRSTELHLSSVRFECQIERLACSRLVLPTSSATLRSGSERIDNHFLDDPGLYDSCCCHLCSSSSSISSTSSSTA